MAKRNFEGFRVFYSGDCESDFVAPVADMTVEDFVGQANGQVEEWGQAVDQVQYTTDDVTVAYVRFYPKGLEGAPDLGQGYSFTDSERGSIKCHRISLN